ncbi:MAG: pentapeptide repeat-containing protein [Gammaproteobacteria bacterium]|nr:pentapeptide repeat-containing protein [Gammaproteobacteria bacterium]
MAASKLQLEQLNRELGSIASELEKKIRAIDAEIVAERDETIRLALISARADLAHSKAELEAELLAVDQNSWMDELPTSDDFADMYPQEDLCSIDESYLLSAHTLEPGLAVEGHQPERIGELLLLGGEIGYKDLSCLQLNGATLSALVLSYRYMEQGVWLNCRFEAIDFSSSVLVRSRFERCTFVDCDFSSANLGGSQLIECRFEKCNFDSSVLSQSKHSGVTVVECQLRGCQLLDVEINSLTIHDSQIYGLTFVEAEMGTLRVNSSQLEAMVFMECKIDLLSITASQMKQTIFTKLDTGTALDLTGTAMENCMFIQQSQMRKARCDGIRCKDVSFHSAVMPESSWVNADLQGTLFAEADLRGADFNGADCRGSSFNRTLLTTAKMDNSNLMECNFGQAHLVNCRFNGSNLYSANFIDAVVGGNSFQQTILDRTILEDWQP